MIKEVDIQSYLVQLRLLGHQPVVAHAQSVGSIHPHTFFCVPESIAYAFPISEDTNIDYCLSEGDYLDSTDMHNIFPVRRFDFERNYVIDDVHSDFRKSLDSMSFEFD